MNTFKNIKFNPCHLKYATYSDRHNSIFKQSNNSLRTLNTNKILMNNVLNSSPLQLIKKRFFMVPTYFNKYLGKHYNTGFSSKMTHMKFNTITMYMSQITTSSKIIDKVSEIMNYHVSLPKQYLFDVNKYIMNTIFTHDTSINGDTELFNILYSANDSIIPFVCFTSFIIFNQSV